MPRFEYKVVPAPTKGLKGKGVKGAEARFSYAIQELMNGLSGYGWEYLRAETLPSVERSGFTKSTTEWRNVLVFRRLRESDADAFAPELLPPPFAPMAANDLAGTSDGDTASETEEIEADTTANLSDNGVEDTDNVEGIGPSLELLVEARKDSKIRCLNLFLKYLHQAQAHECARSDHPPEPHAPRGGAQGGSSP